jgi:hypothetical protein
VSPLDEGDERRRGTHLLVSFAIVAAFTLASWNRLALPFSTAEAVFVHEALRASGQASTPDFSAPDNPVPARVLAVIQQLVGTSERPLRLVFVLLLAASAWFLSELLPRPGVAGVAILTLAMLACGLAPLRPATLVMLPASLALLAAPLGAPMTNLRALLGLAGAVALGAISLRSALVGAGVMAVIAVFRGSAFERVMAFVAAAAGVAAGRVAQSAQSAPGRAYSIASGSGDELFGILLLAGFVVVVIASLLANDGNRRPRVALLFALISGAVAAYFLWLSDLQDVKRPLLQGADLDLSFAAVRVGAILFLGYAVIGFPRFIQALSVVLASGMLAYTLFAGDQDDRTAPLSVLDDARAVAQPGAALAVEGSRRVSVAVYARLGRAPSMPVYYMPETVTPDGLAELCRKNEVQQLWLFPPRSPAQTSEGLKPAEKIPGLSMPETRPAKTRTLMQLIVD